MAANNLAKLPTKTSRRVKLGRQKAGAVEETQSSSKSNSAHAFRPKRPLWLTSLVWLQQGTGVTTLMVVAGVLVTYGWTVYVQQQWGKEFDKLESLKKQERQLVSANEVLKNQMAQQAENPTAGLLLPDPSNAIFLTPAPERPQVKPKPTDPLNQPAPTKPLGY